MAFVSKKRTNSIKDIGDSQNKGIEVGSVDGGKQNKDNSVQAPKYNIGEIKTFRDQAIQVLNILEAKGIDIYDETRTPGMYLRSKNGRRNNKLISALVSNTSEIGKHHHHNHNQKNETTNKLLDFFNSNKKED